MNKFSLLFLLFLFFSLPINLNAQDSSNVFINAGIITNIQKCDECKKSDTGGSIRIGILTDRRFGYFIGYSWFKEYHEDWIEYDDEGSLLFGGIGYRLYKNNNLRIYINLGIGLERFVSTYSNRTEEESSIKPDLGLLFNLNHINLYTGWQPSEPSHYLFGLGFTI